MKKYFICLSSLLKLVNGNHYGVMAKVLDCTFKVSEFKLQSCIDIHFWTNTPPSSGLNSITYSSARMDLALNNPQRLIFH